MAITPEPEVQFFTSLASAAAGRETDVVGDPAGQASDLAAEATRSHGRRRKRSISPEVMRGLAQIADVGAIVVSGLAADQIYLVELGRDPRADYERYWLAIVLAALIFPFAHRKLGGFGAQRLDQLVWQVGGLALALAGHLSLLATLPVLAKVAAFFSPRLAAPFRSLA